MFLHDLKKHLNVAMPYLETLVQNKLLLHQLLAGLPSSTSKQLRARGDTRDVDRVLELLIMTEDQPGQPAAVLELLKEVVLLKEQITELTEQVALLM